jgi:uncharacterized delta-60 repeat protein
MIKVNSNSLNLKGGKTLVGDFEYDGNLIYPFPTNTTVYSTIQQSDNKLVVGGDFITYSGSTVNRIVRMSPDGIQDESFNTGTGFDNIVRTVIQQSDNKIIAGGNFTTYSGSTSNRIVRINPNGTIDATFNAGTGFDNIVQTVIQQSDGKLVAGGDFTTYSGSTVNRIVRLNLDGTIDPTFNIGTGFNGIIFTIIQQSDGKLVVGGDFTTYSGSTSNRIVRINPNGIKDTTYNEGVGFNFAPYSIAEQSNGKLVIIGDFTTYSGSTNNYIVRINPNGTKDTTFNIGTGFGGFGPPIVIYQQLDNKLVVGGFFRRYNSGSNNALGIIRLNPDGTNDLTFNSIKGFDPDAGIYSIIQQPNTKLIMGGFFFSYSGSLADGLISINNDGTITQKRTN